MSCKDHSLKIGAYVDGELPDREGVELESHLVECSDCRRVLVDYRALDRIAAGDPPPPVTGSEWAQVLDQVTDGPESESETKLSSRRWLGPALALAALLVIGVFVGREILDVGRPALDTPGVAEQPARAPEGTASPSATYAERGGPAEDPLQGPEPKDASNRSKPDDESGDSPAGAIDPTDF